MCAIISVAMKNTNIIDFKVHWSSLEARMGGEEAGITGEELGISGEESGITGKKLTQECPGTSTSANFV